MICRRVVLPAPLGPTMAVISLGRMDREMSLSICSEPNDLLMESRSTSGEDIAIRGLLWRGECT